jgi:hypothetical protein
MRVVGIGEGVTVIVGATVLEAWVRDAGRVTPASAHSWYTKMFVAVLQGALINPSLQVFGSL